MDNTISILGSGWLGLPLIQQFVAQGCVIKASTRQPEKLPILEQAGAEAFSVDISKQIPPEFLVSEILIINITSKNQNGFADLIQQIEKSPIEKVLFISSTSVYQNLNREVTEDENAEDHHSELWQIEQLFQNNSHFKTTILRFSGLIDSRRHPGRFFRNGSSVPQADAPVNLIHLEDCLGLIDAILQQGAWGEVFNGCADTHPSKREFYSYARQLMGVSPPEFDTDSDIEYKIISNQKVKIKLNYTFQYTDLMKITF
ncbi:SDR family oxidoreductase [Methylophaga sp.]|uniref:SDR family oxidoreductase n=1 Tax=Methylophaga sp. TaxID=2024840 RepID=UPI00271A3A1F|nr:SDR family oxidoreductase [Methylophaga sp.]MDO8827899.1 SDR family oxidoreductase [Methylophaga sp.]